MRTSKVDRYTKKLIELRELRNREETDLQAEKAVLEVMEVIWESMSIEERKYFSDTTHLSWPPPRDRKKEYK